MTNTIKIITILFLLLCINSCLSDKDRISDTNLNVLTIHEADINYDKKLSEIVEQVILIPLETKEESLIGRIDKLMEYKGLYYILDRDSRKGLIIFDSNGKFINCIDAKGKGPGEFNKLARVS